MLSKLLILLAGGLYMYIPTICKNLQSDLVILLIRIRVAFKSKFLEFKYFMIMNDIVIVFSIDDK